LELDLGAVEEVRCVPFLHHMCSRVHFPGELITAGCTLGWRQAIGGSVMRWTMFCWETLGPDIHVEVYLTPATYLNIVADQVHPFMIMVSPGGTSERQ